MGIDTVSETFRSLVRRNPHLSPASTALLPSFHAEREQSARSILIQCVSSSLEATPNSQLFLHQTDEAIRQAIFVQGRSEGLLPLLLRQLQAEQPSTAVAGLAALIGPDVVAAQTWSLLRARATADVVGQFELAGIEVKAIKGQLLSQAIYGDPACKHSVDIDLIVRPQQAAAAANKLAELGYVCPLHSDWFTDRAFLRLQKEATFSTLRGLLCIDLHWGLVNHWNTCPVELDEIFQSAPSIQLIESTLPWFQPDVLWRIQLGHLISSGWGGLKTFVDFVHVTDRLSDGELETALRRCASLNALDEAIASLRVNEAVFGRSIPTAAAAFVGSASEGRVNQIVRHCVNLLSAVNAEPHVSASAQWWSEMRLAKTYKQFFAAAKSLWTPAMADYERATPSTSKVRIFTAMVTRRSSKRFRRRETAPGG